MAKLDSRAAPLRTRQNCTAPMSISPREKEGRSTNEAHLVQNKKESTVVDSHLQSTVENVLKPIEPVEPNITIFFFIIKFLKLQK